MKMPVGALALITCALICLGCQSLTPDDPKQGAVTKASTPEELGKQFVAAAATGDMRRIGKLYVTREEFRATFEGQDLDSSYDLIYGKFEAAVADVLPHLANAEFVRMNLEYCPEPLRTEPGMNFGFLKCAVSTLVTDNIRVVATVQGEEQEVKLDAVIQVGEEWRLLSPVSLVSRRDITESCVWAE